MSIIYRLLRGYFEIIALSYALPSLCLTSEFPRHGPTHRVRCCSFALAEFSMILSVLCHYFAFHSLTLSFLFSASRFLSHSRGRARTLDMQQMRTSLLNLSEQQATSPPAPSPLSEAASLNAEGTFGSTPSSDLAPSSSSSTTSASLSLEPSAYNFAAGASQANSNESLRDVFAKIKRRMTNIAPAPMSAASSSSSSASSSSVSSGSAPSASSKVAPRKGTVPFARVRVRVRLLRVCVCVCICVCVCVRGVRACVRADFHFRCAHRPAVCTHDRARTRWFCLFPGLARLGKAPA